MQLPPDILQQGGVAPELEEPDSVSFASGAGDAVLLTSTGDDDLIDAQATMHLPSTGVYALKHFPLCSKSNEWWCHRTQLQGFVGGLCCCNDVNHIV